MVGDVMDDKSLQHCVEVFGSAKGVTVCGGGSPAQKGGPQCVCQEELCLYTGCFYRGITLLNPPWKVYSREPQI